MTERLRFIARYDEAMVRDAVRTYARRRLLLGQKRLWLAAALLAALTIVLAASGERDWTVGVMGAGALTPLVFLAAVWRAHFVNTVGTFRRMAKKEAEFFLDEDGFEVVSDLGAARLPWSGVSEVWERPRYWMIFTAPNQFATLPTEALSEQDRAWLRAKTRATGER